jgi:hypothetical protein
VQRQQNVGPSPAVLLFLTAKTLDLSSDKFSGHI